jgi:hypothetical protein
MSFSGTANLTQCPAETARMTQRKRKLDSVPDTGHKRRRPDNVKSPRMKPRRQSPLLEEVKSGNVPNSDRQSGDNHSIIMEAQSNAIVQYTESDSEDDPSESVLSSATETSSDSGISTSESDDEEEDESENLEHVLSTGESPSDLDSPGDDTNIISLPPQPKPTISRATIISSSSALRSRIATFLPQLRKANEDLTNAEDDRRIDAIADDQDHYIEMDLGLGVLKEKPKRVPFHGEIRTRESSNSTTSSGVSSSNSSSDGDGDGDGDSETKRPKKDVMCDLLGKKGKPRRQGGPTIQVLNET